MWFYGIWRLGVEVGLLLGFFAGLGLAVAG